MTKQSPFCQGYRDAIEGTCWDPTPLEVALAHPEYDSDDIDTYINGVDDGMRGDSFRFDLISSSSEEN